MGRKIYNVWLEIEKIDEENCDKGEDLSSIKLGKFKSEKSAIRFHDAVIKMAVAVVKIFPGLVVK